MTLGRIFEKLQVESWKQKYSIHLFAHCVFTGERPNPCYLSNVPGAQSDLKQIQAHHPGINPQGE